MIFLSAISPDIMNELSWFFAHRLNLGKILTGAPRLSDRFNCVGNGLILYTSTPQNVQTYSKNSRAKADELFECVGSFCGVGTYRVKMKIAFRIEKKYMRWFAFFKLILANEKAGLFYQ